MESHLDSLIGVVAVIGVFAVPIVAILVLAAVLMGTVRKRHLERMKMIEAGLMPPQPQRAANWHGLLITGAVLFALGLALLISTVAGGRPGEDLTGGLVLSLVGAALLGCFAFVRQGRRGRASDASQPGNGPSSAS
jgi:hypothetical protein